jgi:hypothetical protein
MKGRNPLKKQIKLHVLIIGVMSVLVYLSSICLADEAQLRTQTKEMRPVQLETQRVSPSQVQKRVIQPEVKVKKPKRTISTRKPVLINEVPKVIWFMDYGGEAWQANNKKGEFIFKYRFKWQDGNGDVCDGKWFIRYDHGHMSGYIRDLMNSDCRSKMHSKPANPKTTGTAGDDYILLKGKDLETITLSFVVKDGAGNVSNKVTRKITLYGPGSD